MQWIQYLLDTGSTVEQVIRSADWIMPDVWPWHFFVADNQTLLLISSRLDPKQL